MHYINTRCTCFLFEKMDVDLSDVASSDPDEQNKSLDGAVNGAYGSVPSPPELTDEDKNLNVEIGSEPWHQAIPLVSFINVFFRLIG